MKQKMMCFQCLQCSPIFSTVATLSCHVKTVHEGRNFISILALHNTQFSKLCLCEYTIDQLQHLNGHSVPLLVTSWFLTSGYSVRRVGQLDMKIHPPDPPRPSRPKAGWILWIKIDECGWQWMK